MVEAVENRMAASDTPSAIRIFIGGLGENVTAVDVENIFVSLGRVHNVELVRTNRRSFGYMDFEPQSDKALAKLFSTYNGCKWKGGKLKLEKAKEHYLSRLTREWEADAAPSIPVNQDVETKKEETKPKNLNLDSMKISIFFPKLNKLKLLPYKGSGKHKYSFQRVEVSSTLPLHFCDCEEHCGPSESANQTYLSVLESAARKKELSIMHSVMNRLLKENGEQEKLVAKPDVVELVENNVEEEGEKFVENSDVLEAVENNVEEEKEYEREEEVMEEESDEDLVINISSRVSDKSILDFKVSDVVPPKQELKESKPQQSTEKILNSNVQKHTVKALEPTEDKQKSSTVSTERTTVDEFSSLLLRNDTSTVESRDQTNDQKTTEKSEKNSDKWFQKSAWRDLVGDSTKNLFSLSSSAQPRDSSIFSNQPASENKVADSTISSKKRKVTPNKEGLILTRPEVKIGEEGENKRPKQEVRRVVQKVTVGEVCSFMKSAESEKEWSNTKKALSGYIKKKSGESSNVSGVRKGAPFSGKRFTK